MNTYENHPSIVRIGNEIRAEFAKAQIEKKDMFVVKAHLPLPDIGHPKLEIATSKDGIVEKDSIEVQERVFKNIRQMLKDYFESLDDIGEVLKRANLNFQIRPGMESFDIRKGPNELQLYCYDLLMIDIIGRVVNPT